MLRLRSLAVRSAGSPLAHDGFCPCIVGTLRRGRLRRHDLPQANWLEGFTS